MKTAGFAGGNTGAQTILVLAEKVRERELICRVAAKAGFVPKAAGSIDEFCNEVDAGAAVGVLTQEALSGGEFDKLAAALETPPSGPDLPLVIVTPRAGGPNGHRRLRTAIVVQRPLRAAPLVNALQTGMRQRWQQYELRSTAERENLRRQLQAERERLELAEEAGNIGVFEWRAGERRMTVSPQLERICGLSPGSFDGTMEAVEAAVHPEDREQLRQAIAAVMVRSGHLDLECRVVRPDGSVRWLHIRGQRLAGEPDRMVGMATDITERKQAEQERERLLRQLADDRTRLEQVLDKMPVGVIIAEVPSGRLIFQNRRIAEMHRHPSLQSESVEDYGAWQPHREDGTPYPLNELPLARTVRNGETVIGEEIKFPVGPGEWLHVRVNAAPVRDTNGNIVCGALVIDDISEVKRAEAAAQKSEAGLARAQRIAHLGDWERNLVTGELRWSDEVFRIFGLDSRTFAPSYEAFLERVHPDDRPLIKEAAARAIERGEPYHMDHRIILPDGAVRTVNEHAEVLYDAAGQRVAFVGTVLDITERKRAEAALRESDERFRAFMDHSPNTAWAKDEEGHYVYLNAAYERHFLVRFEDWRGKTDYELWPPKTAREFLRNDAEVLASGESISLYESVPNPDGTYTDWWTFKFPFRDAAGKRYVGGIGIDVTERNLMEERLRQAQKMESIGLLAGGIAHDFNNLLAGILGFASLLRDEVPAESVQKVDFILGGAEKAADLTRQLLAYAGKGRFVVEAVDIARVVREMTDLVRGSISKKIAIDLSLDRDVPAVQADQGQIQQVVMNLLLNAAEAVGENQAGTVFVRVSAAEITPSNAPIDAVSGEGLPGGSYVCVEIRDTGCGMEGETLAKIFDPFFTTKFMGRGLGLAAVAGVVKTHGGGIEVESALGEGTAFRVFLPAARESGAHAGRPDAAGVRGAGTVLVVDDEKTVREFARAALEKFGYRVLTAPNGLEAVRLFEREPRAVDAVLLDLRMPVLGGEDAIEALRAARPDLKVVLMSGYGEMEAARMFDGKGIAAFLQKPFTASRLAEQVKTVLREQT